MQPTDPRDAQIAALVGAASRFMLKLESMAGVRLLELDDLRHFLNEKSAISAQAAQSNGGDELT